MRIEITKNSGGGYSIDQFTSGGSHVSNARGPIKVIIEELLKMTGDDDEFRLVKKPKKKS